MDNIAHWKQSIQTLAQSGALLTALSESFGLANDPTGLQHAIAAMAHGSSSALPDVQVIDAASMNGLAGAYSPQTTTIYLNSAFVNHTDATLEILTHELGHHLLSAYFDPAQSDSDISTFLTRLIGSDQPLLLSQSAPSGTHAGTIVVPGSIAPLEVEGFKTDLHIAWVQAKLPMLNAQGFKVIEQAQEDTDAFPGVLYVGGPFGEKYSPYGLQFHSDSHFDQNNIRGAVETLRKRWTHGIDQFGSNSVDNYNNLLIRDRAFVGRDFKGNDAGVENLLYRFGQISHALQDFYSHSNWLELSRVPGKNWIAQDALLDSGLGLPTPLNPGDLVPTTNRVMVAMDGYNYAQAFNKVGSSVFGLTSQSVYWWVDIGQSAWGEVYATPRPNQPLSGSTVAGLMSGGVNEAIYYSTDYSVPLRAIGRTGFFEQEYFRGFSHGGKAGAFIGQWVRPLAKDSADNERFSDKNANASLYEGARQLADLQLRNDWDRMGNLIFQEYGVDGLSKFANYAVMPESRAQYISTYSKPGARWNWDAVLQPLGELQLLALGAAPAPASDSAPEGDFRQIKVFFDLPGSTANTLDNIQILTQIKDGNRWVDSAAGVVGLHHEEVDPALMYRAAAVQHQDPAYTGLKPNPPGGLKPGGRALWSERLNDYSDHLATLYTVENVNTHARVYINQFDVTHDELRIVDANGLDVALIDIDRADFEEVRKSILDQYNILINARPEYEAISSERVLSKQSAVGPVVLAASDFFSDSDFVLANLDGAGAPARSLRFVSHDATLPWLKLTNAGELQIDDLSAIAPGTYSVYVSVTDGTGTAESGHITLSIDPQVLVNGQSYQPTTLIRLDFPELSQAAVQIYTQVFDGRNNPVGELNQVAMSLGKNWGTPAGLETGFSDSILADPTDHGTVRLFARLGENASLVELAVQNAGADTYRLLAGDQLVARLSMGGAAPTPTHSAPAVINELYVPSIDDIMLGIPLKHNVSSVDVTDADRPHQVSITMMMYREALIDSEFGFLLADLSTGHPINPKDGTVAERAFVTVDNLASFSVFSATAPRSEAVQRSGSFALDKDLNPDGLALLPYLKVGTGDSARLFFSADTSSPDGINHVARLNGYTFGCEDLVGGDYDFDDMVAVVKSLIVTDHY